MSTLGHPFVVQKGLTFLRLEGVFEYPRYVARIEDASLLSYAKAHQLAACLSGNVVAAELRVQSPVATQEAVPPHVTVASIPPGTSHVFGPGYGYTVEEL